MKINRGSLLHRLYEATTIGDNGMNGATGMSGATGINTIGNNMKADRESCRMGVVGFIVAVLGLCIFFYGLFALAGLLLSLI
ncbi:MAG: hypothetical protein UT94_C0024G0016 [Candidatus Uhrbacteria bacterium GW2011_GWF2_40_263]|nr:MAG: hypothetical protein UT94_C0024G0016 [Candidatus Uhrbacteria bacterium GW2011_GWF2_40_263]